MKVFAISDLHLSIHCPKPMDVFGGPWDDYLDVIADDWRQKVDENDVVLISGDISWAMTLEHAVLDLQFIAGLSGKKVIIRGNHDYWWKSISAVRAALPSGMFALQNDCLRLDNTLFCGSRGWGLDCPTAQDKKIFDRELIRLRLSLEQMSNMRKDGDRVVAMIHYPPFDALAQSSKMTDLFAEFKVDKVVYGHLHGKKVRVIPKAVLSGVEYLLSSCDLVKNRLVEVF